MAKAKRKGATAAPVSRGDGKKRYAATQERGESTYKKEWSHFISGVEVADLGAKISIDSERDHAEDAGRSTFSYLFGAKDKKKQEKPEKRAKDVEEGPSRMQKLLDRATTKGVELDGLNRKQRRQLLEADKTDSQLKKEAKEAKAAKEQEDGLPPRPKMHELMDKKLAWYQQGPHPVDEISERLVLKKAQKHARQNGWKYNFEAPHPSWLAVRARRRKESNLWSTGQHTRFDDPV